MFINYQKVFDYINNNFDKYHAIVRFSNLTSYFDAVKTELNGQRAQVPILKGDFFTYADRDQDYWSGYFTSRPFYKRLGRRTQSTVRAAELLVKLGFFAEFYFCFANDIQQFIDIKHSLVHVRLGNSGKDEPNTLREALLDARRTMGIYQHHDAGINTKKKKKNQKECVRFTNIF